MLIGEQYGEGRQNGRREVALVAGRERSSVRDLWQAE